MWQAILATAVGFGFTAAARLIDRFLPDPEGKHPLPPVQQPAPPTGRKK